MAVLCMTRVSSLLSYQSMDKGMLFEDISSIVLTNYTHYFFQVLYQNAQNEECSFPCPQHEGISNLSPISLYNKT